ncbi:hypothetical protein LUZ60_007599 [Juncus effusus]|nr:hypothetical protein LUZ60_007599 [Juncus effusus]
MIPLFLLRTICQIHLSRSMGREEQKKPLLDKSPSRSLEGGRTQLEQKAFNWRAPAIILGVIFLENIAYFAVALNLVVYLGTVLRGSTISNAVNVDLWRGTGYLTPVLGAFLADTYLGKYNTVFISLIFYLLGMLTITASAMFLSLQPVTCTVVSCPTTTSFQYFIFFFGLYLISIGTGGIKSVITPFGADQYSDSDYPDQMTKRQSFFVALFVLQNLAILIDGTVVVWIQENIAWHIGFGIGSSCIVIATFGFLIGAPIYRVQSPAGSPLKNVVRVFISALKNRNSEMPRDSVLLYEELEKEDDMGIDNECQPKLAHTDGLRFLDKAAIITVEPNSTSSTRTTRWTWCTVSQVEEVKILLRMIPIWLTCVFNSAAMCQTTTTFIQQGNLMNTKVFSLSIPAASFSSLNIIFMLIFILIHNYIVIPLAKKCTGDPFGLTRLQRMGIGRFLAIFSMASAAVLETFRISYYKEGKYLSIMYQLPQYLIIACCEAFYGLAQLEFFYEDAPKSMKSLYNVLLFLATSFGYYVNSVVVTFIGSITSTGGGAGWLPSDLNKGHLDYYFWLWVGISSVNFVAYVVISHCYTHKKVVLN